MKKLMILSAAALAIFLAMPQFAEATTVQNNITVTQSVKYTEITAATLPEAVTATLTKDFVGYSIDKIFQGDDGTFKLAVRKGTVKSTLLFNTKGELIK